MTQFDLFGDNSDKAPKAEAKKVAPAPVKAPPPAPRPLPTLNPPFASKSATSTAAAEAIRFNASSLRDKVYAALVRAGAQGMTDSELEVTLKMRLQTVVPRRGELVKLGRVCDSGRTRLTQTRRHATVWVARKDALSDSYVGMTPADVQRLKGDPLLQKARENALNVFGKKDQPK